VLERTAGPTCRRWAEMDISEKEDAYAEFDHMVNMSPAELGKWLETSESPQVGMKHEGEDEAVGHRSGRRIVAIKRTKNRS
jgi:hypothetical protein